MLFLVDLPNPVHGMSTINRRFVDHFNQQAIEHDIINTVPSYAARFFGKPLWLVIKLLHTLVCFLRLTAYLLLHPGCVVYRSINGGSGLWYDIIYLGLCRILGATTFIHHHSFNYINNDHPAFRIIQRICAEHTTHIVLGEDMARLLGIRYGIPLSRIRVQSNLAFFNMQPVHHERPVQQPIAIGHLANLCFEKGLDTFITVCYQLHQRKIAFDAYLAGPINDEAVRNAVEKVTRELRNVHYVGPVYDDSKRQFYEKLDAFIFPTRYINEAEPLVLYEAATSGALLVGTPRGCMESVIQSLGGYTTPENSKTASNITEILANAQDNHEFDHVHRAARVNRFSALQHQATHALDQLFTEIQLSYVPET